MAGASPRERDDPEEAGRPPTRRAPRAPRRAPLCHRRQDCRECEVSAHEPLPPRTPRGLTPMYLDRQLWAFTEGVRLRIAATVLVGLLQVAAGIARLALLGWLLGRVFQGASLEALALPIALTAAVILARGA